jgi:hypothetical protein
MILLTNMAHGLPYCFYIIMQTVCINVKLTHPLMHTCTHTHVITEYPKAIIKNINTIIHKHDSNTDAGSYSYFTAKNKVITNSNFHTHTHTHRHAHACTDTRTYVVRMHAHKHTNTHAFSEDFLYFHRRMNFTVFIQGNQRTKIKSA